MGVAFLGSSASSELILYGIIWDTEMWSWKVKAIKEIIINIL
jgi:hypothetical protein